MALRKGNQRPTFSTVGRWSYTDGEYAAKMFSDYGIKFYESQRYELHVFLARNEDGSYAAKTICISKPRQNGKSFAARFYAIWMAAIEGKHALFSAHHGKTVRKMFKEIRNFIENTPDFYAMLKPKNGIYAAAGTEGIYFVDEYGNDAGLIEFQTRTNSAARGETYQVIIVDEAQELTAEQLEALKPTTIAADDAEKVDSDPQMIYLGTPPNLKCVGTEFRRWHDEAHSDKQSSIWWMEWAVDEIPDMTDRKAVMELVYLTNPAMGYRIKESTMYDVMDTMSAEGFARECLGWWSAVNLLLDFAIAANKYESLAVDNPPTQGRVAYGVKFSPDGAEVSLAAARLHDNRVYIEQIRRESMALGLMWITEWIAARKNIGCCCVIDGKSGTQALVDKLGVMPKGYIEVPTAAQVVSACTTLVDRVNDGTLEWFRPQTDLRDSAITSTRRKIGQTGGWGFAGENPIPIEAASLALWGVLNSKRNPERKQRIG